MAPHALLLVIMVMGFPSLCLGSQCTLVVDQLEYDLSMLAAEEHWLVRRTLHFGENDQLIYISLCHPLKAVPAGCGGNNTGVCIVENVTEDNPHVTVANAGQVPSGGLTLPQQMGRLEYVMDNGMPCAEARGEIYRTYINFICTHDFEEETGPVLMSFVRCQLLLAWMTKAACPRKLDTVSTSPCSLEFPSTGHMLHLQTLRSNRFFHAMSVEPQVRYEINICGPIVNGSCEAEDVAVCYMPLGENPAVLATTRGMNVRWEESKNLVLTYQGVNQKQNVEIRFTCDRSAAETRINYVTQNASTIVFVVRTSTVCVPTPIPDCVLEDHAGNVFDLRPLHLVRDNWEVLRSTDDDQEILYYLNMCGPVNSATHHSCPSGLIGACMARMNGDVAYNIGLLTSEPTINAENGFITVLYTGGDPCKGGEHSHSTRINLICNPIEHGPILVKETETCEHVFDWLTPVACPRNFTIGIDCKVEDPHYHNIYDLNPLRNMKKDYVVKSDGNEVLINLCGPLVSSCDGHNDTGVCQVTKDHRLNEGLYTTQVIFNDGTLMMKYTNGTGDCKDNSTRSSDIIFLCDHDSSGRNGPTLVKHNECSNSFFWKTKFACPTFHVVDCTLYTTDGMMYNLQELSLSDSNLEYYTSDNKKFVFNVCRSVVHQKGSRCPYRAGACIIDRTHHNSSVNIGEVQSGPYLEDGRLVMRYADGDECEGRKQLYQTLIEFKCDKDETYPYPQLIGEENCTYYFEVKSAAACPVSIENATLPMVGRKCAVTSPNGYTFDLSSLKRETNYKVKGTTLTLNVCGALKSPECPGVNAGICNKNINAGQANDNLYYLPEHLSLHYTGGDQCSSGVNRSTIITFVCGAENVTEGPVLVFEDKDHCIYFITWYTELACERRIPCYVDTYTHRIDLSTFIRSSGNYEAVGQRNSKEKFYINVCRPLNPIIGLNCRPGSAVCVSSSSEGKNPLSLGHPVKRPVSDGSGGAMIMYIHGAKCITEPDNNYSTKIHFICDPSAGKGNPVYKNLTHECQYLFEWRTSVACDMLFKEEDSGPQCQIRYDEAKTNINLKPLQHPEGYRLKFGNKTFIVNVCGPACNTSGTCSSDGESYGLSNKSDLEWHYGQLKLQYYGGSPCNGSLSGHKTTTVLFECDMSAGYGFPVPDDLMWSMDCHAIFNWKTNVTCIEGIYATEDPSRPTPMNKTEKNNTPSKDLLTDTTTSTNSTVIGILVGLCGLVLVAALVIFKSKRGNRIVAATRKFFGIHGYSSHHARIENSTLLGATDSIRIFKPDDSDDDLLRV